MKKVGIVTLVGYFNYGNRLQNYALQETLKKLDVDVTSLIFDQQEGFLLTNNEKLERTKNFSKLDKVKRRLKGKSLSEIFQFASKKMKSILINNPREKNRTEIFLDFTQKNINEEKFAGNESDYDYYVVGSDQVWNPNFIKNKPQYLLGFASNEKRISYAASFGVSTLPEIAQPVFKEEISKFSNISVREEAGADLVQNLTGRDASVHVDPTMLLTKTEWLSVSKKAKNRPNSPYILTYFLGGPNDETREDISKISKEKGMTVINLGDINEKDTYETGPSEFLDYINNASAFFTDSFHGVVYSIIFETPFIIYERKSSTGSMYSRIDTILENFSLKHREAKNFNEDVFTVDFSGSKEIMLKEYEKSMEYLKNALDIND